MITKGIVEKIIDKYSVRVRIPTLDRVTSTSLNTSVDLLSIAHICTIPNVTINLKVNDVVIVGNEESDLNKWFILGVLFTKNVGPTYSDFHVNSLVAENNSKLSENTTIGNVTAQDIKCLQNCKGNIQKQFDTHGLRLTKLENLQINTFTCTPTYVEMGQFINTATLQWTLNMNPTSMQINNVVIPNMNTRHLNINLQSMAMLSDLTLADLRNLNLSQVGFYAVAQQDNINFTLTVTDANNNRISKQTSLKFVNKVYWGSANLPQTINSNFILNLEHSELCETPKRTIKESCSNKYIWYALPSAFDAPFFISSTLCAFEKCASNMSFTNANNYTTTYDVWRTTQPVTGNQGIIII